MSRAWVFLGSALLVASCDRDSRFNLDCTFPASNGKTADAVDNAPTVLHVLRVDLKAKRFCADDCVETQEIRSITDHKIELDPPSPETFETHAVAIYRESGRAYLSESEMGGRFIRGRPGQCQRKPFGGFPEPKF